MTLESYLLAAPKAELHVHLEGSIMPETLLRLARRNHVALPADDIRGLSEWFRFRDFAHFVEVYVGIARCLKTVEDYELIAYEFGAAMARQNVRYSEVTTTPSMHRNLGIPFATYFDGLTRGRERAAREFGVEIAWIFDIVRGGPDAARLLAGADYATSAAIEHQRDGVIALGLAGMESGFPPEPFAPWFERARTAGLHCIPHAGEHAGPASIWGALHALGAERIAHGVRAIEDAELVEYLAQQRIALEVCPSSNVCLGVYPSLTEHPLRRLYDAGVPLTINTDDPPLFDTSLDGEVLSLATVFGLDVAAIDEILLNGVRYCFLPEARRRALEGDFRTELAALKRTHLPDTGL